jgi:DinB family protein
MRERLQQSLRALDEKRRRLLDEVEALSAERLTAKPLPGKWSILEIVEHLVLAERDVLQNLPEPAQLVDRPRHLKARVGYPLVMFVLKHGIPAKVPSPRMLPTGSASLAALRGQWDETALDWRKTLIAASKAAVNPIKRLDQMVISPTGQPVLQGDGQSFVIV